MLTEDVIQPNNRGDLILGLNVKLGSKHNSWFKWLQEQLWCNLSKRLSFPTFLVDRKRVNWNLLRSSVYCSQSTLSVPTGCLVERKMGKGVALRSLFRSLSSRSHRFSANNNHILRTSHTRHRDFLAVRTLFNLSPSHVSSSADRLSTECKSPLSTGLGSVRFYSKHVTDLPEIKDPKLQNAFKDLMAVNWDELPHAVIYDVKAGLTVNTDDKAGKEIVENVFRAAEAIEEFSGILVTLKMEIDDSIGLSGEDAKPTPDHIKNALQTVFGRYSTYLSSFGLDESYLRKKVETELGTKMIHLKMRCSGLGSEWGKVSVLGTSGLAGSYVEQRA